MAEKQETTKKRSIIPYLLLFLLISCASTGGGVVYLIRQKPEILGLAIDTTITERKEQKKIIEELSKILDLPQDETPIITTVTDTSELSTESSFKNVKEGDKKIEYPKAGEIIIYRLSESKLIGILYKKEEVTLQPPQPTPFVPVATTEAAVASTSATVSSMRFALYNGTTAVGATRAIELKIKEKYSNNEITARAVATRTDYSETIIVDLTGSRSEEAKKIAADLGISVGAFPEGEKVPENTDFLVVVGKN